jgi:hypothetical protein
MAQIVPTATTGKVAATVGLTWWAQRKLTTKY